MLIAWFCHSPDCCCKFEVNLQNVSKMGRLVMAFRTGEFVGDQWGDRPLLTLKNPGMKPRLLLQI